MASDKKFLLISMDDSRAKKLADVLGNKTCKKIIDLLAEKEISEKDISVELKVPINTIEYNLKKLLEAEIVEKSKDFFWSRKGRKIDIYKLSNKSIIISPKNKVSSKIKSLVPAILVSLVGAIGIRQYYLNEVYLRNSVKDVSVQATNILAESGDYFATQQPFPSWGWFLLGALLVLIVITIINWRKL